MSYVLDFSLVVLKKRRNGSLVLKFINFAADDKEDILGVLE